MLYPSSGTIIRADLQAVVEEVYTKNDFSIGVDVAPPIMVTAKAGIYPKVTMANAELQTPGATVRSRAGTYNRVIRSYTTDTYETVDRGLEDAIDDIDAKDLARFFDYEVSVARWTLRNILLDHEYRVASLIQNTSNFSSSNSTVAYTEANLATIDFPADILNAIDALNGYGVVPNTIVLSQQVLSRISRSAKLQAFIRGALPNDATLKINSVNLAQAFADYGIERVLIGRNKYNSAKKGQNPSLTNIWSNSYIWVGYVNPNATLIEDVGACATLVWNAEGGFVVTETYRDEQRRCNVIRVRQNTCEKVINTYAGRLINTQWA